MSRNNDPSVRFPKNDCRTKIFPYPNVGTQAELKIDDVSNLWLILFHQRGSFFPADWVYVVPHNPVGSITHHGPYMVQMVMEGKYSLCSEDGMPVAVGGREFFEEEELQAAS